MSTWAVLPVRSFGEGKQRLAGELDDAGRATLCRALLDDALAALAEVETPLTVLVVSADAAVLEHARAAGVQVLADPGQGLNTAVQAAAGHAQARGADTLVVMHADLPLVCAGAIDAVLRTHRRVLPPACTLVPDRHQQGTNVLVASPPQALPFAFGEGSLDRHLMLAARRALCCRIMPSDALGFDLDTAEDWQALREYPALAGGKALAYLRENSTSAAS